MSAALRTLAFLALLTALPARAEIVHVVASGETLSGVAARYYGAGWKHVYLSGANGLDTDRPKAGTRLRVPAVWVYKVRPGDSLSAIAKKHLGDGRRHVFLARFNGVQNAGAVHTGARLLMPIQLRHRARRGETLESIARLYYRNGRMEHLLRDYNFLPSSRVAPGEAVLVPVFDRAAEAAAVRARAGLRRAEKSAPPKAAPQRPAPAPKAPVKASRPERPEPAKLVIDVPEPEVDREEAPEGGARLREATFEADLEAAESLYREGAYGDAVEALGGLLDRSGDFEADLRARFHGSLAEALIAVGRRGEALEQFRHMLTVEPEAVLDPVFTSPKILEVFRQAQDDQEPDAAGEDL